MIRKHKCKRKSTSIFFLKRCAFLFSFLLISFFKGQIFVGEGAIIFDKDNTITDKTTTQDNIDLNKNVDSAIRSISTKHKISAPEKKPKPKILITKQEIAQKKITKIIDDRHAKKVSIKFLSGDRDVYSFINSAYSDTHIGVINYNYNLFAELSSLDFFLYQHNKIAEKQYRILTFVYKNNINCAHSVRPPPQIS